jgi:hypothetical protein
MLGKRIAIGALTALCAVGAGCSDDLWVTSENVELVDGKPKGGPGGSCRIVFGGRFGEPDDAELSGGTPDRDFYYTESREGDAYVVVIRSQSKELARREYSEVQLRSGKRDQFTVTTLAGYTYQLTYWGGSECGLPDVEAE